jgi:predicted DNA-binding protein (UPF0251 family)
MQCRFCRLSLNNHGGSEGMGVQVRIDAGLAARSSPGVYAKRGDYSHSVKLKQADLFQAAGAQEACRTRTPARLTSAQQSAAVVSAAEKLSLRHILPRDLSNALKQLDDGELDRLLEAIGYELQRRGRSLTSTLVIRPTTQMSTEQRASDQLTTTEKSPERRQPEEPNVALTQGQVNAVRATFKAGITPSRIARQFGISQSDVRKVLTSESRRSGKSK